MANYTLNFDGSHNNQASTASAGCIIRDFEGDLVIAASYDLTETLPYYDVAIVEAIGLKNGLKLALQHDLNINLIKGDNREVIDLVLDRARRQPIARPDLARIIEDIKKMVSSQEGFVVIRLIKRDDNKVADRLASLGTRLSVLNYRVFTDCSELPPAV